MKKQEEQLLPDLQGFFFSLQLKPGVSFCELAVFPGTAEREPGSRGGGGGGGWVGGGRLFRRGGEPMRREEEDDGSQH